jgi:hypothetical protein
LENDQPQGGKNGIINKKKLALILTAIIVIAVAASATAVLMNSQQAPSNQANNQNSQTSNQNNVTSNQASSQSWIKKGAYATYQGQATILSISVSFNARMEIIDVNQTHMQISTFYNMLTPYGATENTTTTWVSRENMNFEPEGLPLNSTYTTQIAIPNLGTRTCTVYEYDSGGISATYYVDNSIQWPIKMVMTSPTVEGQSYNMDINIVDTNIPGL